MNRRAPIAALALLLFVPSVTHAAVRTCTEAIASAGQDASSESAAKQKALAGWTASASRFGPAFVLWRNAAGKSLSCMKLSSGTWRCEAHGRACGISQVPGTQPPGSTLPQSPGAPKSKGLQI
jgi:hypothetical protein